MLEPEAIKIPEELPIAEREAEIVRTIRNHQVVIIRGETGSGKTTQIPKLCLKAGLGRKRMVGCTQPRRVAAFAVANRIAEELGPAGRGIVGSKIRFTDSTNRHTRIKVMTDGILLNEMQNDPLLKRYNAIIVDEAHERSLNIDFIIGHLLYVLKKRRDLKVIITSATIDTQQFSELFGGAPVIEVTGRMFPVEVRYEPFGLDEATKDYTYIEASFDAIESILASSRNGDLLVFLPAEKDIRELCDQLDGDYGRSFDIVPLFGRLTQAEQQRIFRVGQKRRIVVATNIAETSITVPGIRYVVDSGLARLSRYSSHTRTQRLPIEAISQSSANQRKGRCGRVAEGICVRLYSEEDFLDRPEFTPPEISRSNLASVILRLKAFNFGSIETFPFLDRPEDRAIQGGMILLKELSAVDEDGELTELGRKLARLPIDPTIGRMLMEAEKLGVQRSVLIIASALAIQDPRERPLEKEKLAEQEHRKFRINHSDFLTLLQIWVEFDGKYEKWSQSKMRKFCREHYISYQRLREWREIHNQIVGILSDLKSLRKSHGEDDPDLVHRSILTGLIGNVAFLEDGNWYHATRGRKVMVFPGSVMFRKQERKPKVKGKPPAKVANRKKEWIVAAEFVETSRLFARTVAKVDEQFIREAGAHLIRNSYVEPHWSKKSQRVLVWNNEFLYGLQVGKRRTGYHQVNPQAAKEIFIREGLIEDGLRDRFPFVEHNQKLRDDITELQIRLRRSISFDLDYKLYQFYDRLLPSMSSVAELHKWWKSLDTEARKKAFLNENDIVDNSVGRDELSMYPESVDLGGTELDIDYIFNPGEKNDGATLKLPISQFEGIQEGSLDWLVPGFLELKVEQLLRSLPKDYRRFLTPIREKSVEIFKGLKPSPNSILRDLSHRIEELYNLRIPLKLWDLNAVPEHVRLKIELLEDDSGESLAQSSDWKVLTETAERRIAKLGVSCGKHNRNSIWKDACAKWEREALKDWSFEDLPESVLLGHFQEVPLYAYPGLAANQRGDVAVRLFKTREDALKFTPNAYRKLCEWSVGREIGWFVRDLKKLKDVYVSFSDQYLWDDFKGDIEQLVLGSLFSRNLKWPLTKAEFANRVESGKRNLRSMEYDLRDVLSKIGNQRMELLNGADSKHPLSQQILVRLFPKRFIRIYDFNRLKQLPRFLKAHSVRLKRAKNHPAKDSEKRERLQPLLASYAQLMKTLPPKNPGISSKVRDLFFDLEELRVSVFAQELGTSKKVSEKTVQSSIELIRKDIEECR